MQWNEPVIVPLLLYLWWIFYSLESNKACIFFYIFHGLDKYDSCHRDTLHRGEDVKELDKKARTAVGKEPVVAVGAAADGSSSILFQLVDHDAQRHDSQQYEPAEPTLKTLGLRLENYFDAQPSTILVIKQVGSRDVVGMQIFDVIVPLEEVVPRVQEKKTDVRHEEDPILVGKNPRIRPVGALAHVLI